MIVRCVEIKVGKKPKPDSLNGAGSSVQTCNALILKDINVGFCPVSGVFLNVDILSKVKRQPFVQTIIFVKTTNPNVQY